MRHALSTQCYSLLHRVWLTSVELAECVLRPRECCGRTGPTTHSLRGVWALMPVPGTTTVPQDSGAEEQGAELSSLRGCLERRWERIPPSRSALAMEVCTGPAQGGGCAGQALRENEAVSAAPAQKPLPSGKCVSQKAATSTHYDRPISHMHILRHNIFCRLYYSPPHEEEKLLT